MRLDKFLKISRIIKRRSVAKDISDQGRILVNCKEAKSSTKVGVGDELTIKFGNKTLVVKVTALLESTKKADTDRMFKIISETYERDFNQETSELN
ncbi:RNA-binding S4 domain-containing protein [Lactobacillus sp. S2-2]|uniref:RNA-binding S4 domain-containing protein n=1 Tax=Lactobacillus sp. S2-2 TaxID=2692917 RepID=UPI001F43C130|nr:RNA-binding S4 domain-containing protein [Lactobacillus sp. S2-2]MCF6515875.1 RNA-binding S4 domain-containing protein [Lactobacillus sp. S2-2]